MSLSSFKETLKPCSSLSSSAPISSYPNSLLSDDFELPVNPRKPPKSSLSQQLLRLHDHEPFSAPQFEPRKPQRHTQIDNDENSGDEEEGEEFEKNERVGRPKPAVFQFDQTGPFEPLVLSSPGETPVIKVEFCSFAFTFA